MQEAFKTLLEQGGMTGALIVVVITISIMLIKRLEKKDAGFEEFLKGLTQTIKLQNEAFIAHNERAAINHQTLLGSFAQVQRDHEKMLDYHTKIIMSLSIQDKSIIDFEKDVGEIKCVLRNLEKAQR
jgi:hypothetical protein